MVSGTVDGSIRDAPPTRGMKDDDRRRRDSAAWVRGRWALTMTSGTEAKPRAPVST